MRPKTTVFIGLLFTLLLCGPGFLHAQSDDVIVVPRYPGDLPNVSVERPDVPSRTKTSTLPSDRAGLSHDTPTVADTVDVRTVKPTLLSSLNPSDTSSRTIREEQQRELTSEGYFFVNGQVKGVGWAKLYLYDHRGGFFDPYDGDDEMNLLGTTYMDGNGEFRIGPIQFKNRWYYQGKDIVLVMELESPYAVAYSDLYGSVQPFRFKIAERKRVTPEGGSYSIGTIQLGLDRDRYYPVRAFDRIVNRLREEGRSTDQKVRIEFVRDVDEPRYMEEIGYILMPYSGGANE